VNTEVHLLPDTDHCAICKAPEVIPMMIDWLRRQFATVPA
jgi:esterase FrsA